VTALAFPRFGADDPRMQRLWIAAGGIAGCLAVAMAAVAAHALGGLPADRVGMVESAIRMQGWHGLALLFCGLWSPRAGRLADAAGAAFLAGLVLFCGAVYALALGGVATGPVAPTGGVLLMLGWLLLAVSAVRPWPS